MVLLNMLAGQREHSVVELGSCPAGHDDAVHSDAPSRLNFPSVQGEQRSVDTVLLMVLT